MEKRLAVAFSLPVSVSSHLQKLPPFVSHLPLAAAERPSVASVSEEAEYTCMAYSADALVPPFLLLHGHFHKSVIRRDILSRMHSASAT